MPITENINTFSALSMHSNLYISIKVPRHSMTMPGDSTLDHLPHQQLNVPVIKTPGAAMMVAIGKIGSNIFNEQDASHLIIFIVT